MALLRLNDVKLTYNIEGRESPVLNSINLTVERGEMVAILGPSGSGKSTLLYILGCLLKPTDGAYEFAGHDITQMSAERLAELRSAEIGFVFQQFHLLPRASVLQNVLMAAQYHTSAEGADSLHARAEKLLTDLGLGDRLKHRPNQLSGGQQQRVAIARALMNNPELILADEPTGNLDSKSTEQVLKTLTEINKTGRTVIIITHDQNVAKHCRRVVTINDGLLEELNPPPKAADEPPAKVLPVRPSSLIPIREIGPGLRTAWQNLLRNKTRSMLTMLGVTIGIAAVMSTITLGNFTQKKIMEGYESLGVNKLVLRAYPRWNVKAVDIKGPKYDGMSQENDVVPMKKLFPEIQLVSPVVMDWNVSTVESGGHTVDQIRAYGVTPEYFAITNRELAIGHPITQYHIDNHSSVCVIGHEIAEKLFNGVSPLHQALRLSGNDKQYSCLIIGVLQSVVTNDEGAHPNLQVILPESYLALMANRSASRPYELDMKMRGDASLEDLATKVKNFLLKKYGKSADIRLDSNQMLIAQMRKFLNLFTMLLAGVAFISLGVGGIGITNMMFVSVAERFKEIGLRKALGARDDEIRLQFLIESLILCGIAGITGVVLGAAGYHTILYLASKLFPKVQFEWVFSFPAIALSVVCIAVVGLASGLVPALRAQKLEVVEALRSE